jgi:hypothetical protein
MLPFEAFEGTVNYFGSTFEPNGTCQRCAQVGTAFFQVVKLLLSINKKAMCGLWILIIWLKTITLHEALCIAL